MRIIIDYPEDCTESEAVTYASGCFNQKQHDYKAVQEGYANGYGFMFCDDRKGFFYKTCHGNYVLRLEPKE